MFVTIVAGYLDPARHTVDLANAGHHPVLLMRGSTVEALAAEAPPLGVLPGIEFSGREVVLDGAALYFYTDGLSESRTATGEQMDSAGLQRLIGEVRSVDPHERLPALVERWREAGHHSHDDITLMLIEIA
jgi:serine phosphatase RsbU (regulator of sigma subunit)